MQTTGTHAPKAVSHPLGDAFIAPKLILIPFKPFAYARDIMHRPRRVYPLVDAMKGVSVLMVILYHVFGGVTLLFREKPEKIVAFIEAVPRVVDLAFNTDKAVDIFFLLSSFLLSTVLYKSVDRSGGINIRRFYLHRFFRLYPLFLIALLLYGLQRPRDLISYGWYSLIFIDNIFGKSIIPVGWSLSVEVQFYLVLPFLILFTAKSRRPILWLVAMTLFSLLLCAQLVWAAPFVYKTPWHEFLANGGLDKYFAAIHFYTRCRVTPLIMGVLWAHLVLRYPPGSILLPRALASGLGISAAVVLYLSMLFPVARASSLYYAHFSEALNFFLIVTHRFFFSTAVLVLALLVQYGTSPEQPRLINRIIEWRVWRLLSEVAYPMYLFHFPLVIVASVLVLQEVNPAKIHEMPLHTLALIFIVATSLTLYVSLWLNHGVEARWIKKGREIEQRLFPEELRTRNRNRV